MAKILVEIIESLGSTPRASGTWMLVDEAGIEGTIGGGALEFRAIERAREMLVEEGDEPVDVSLPLGPALGQCCGGYVKLQLSPAPDTDELDAKRAALMARWPELWLFGAGHVGKAVVQAMADLPVRLTWIDGRAEQFPLTTPENTKTICTATPVALVDQTPKDAAILVMTHEHALDLALITRAIETAHRGFLGLIGSATKRVRFERAIRAKGLDPAHLTCPIGLSMIKGKEPAVIAASVTAQLLSVFEAQLAVANQPAVVSA